MTKKEKSELRTNISRLQHAASVFEKICAQILDELDLKEAYVRWEQGVANFPSTSVSGAKLCVELVCGKYALNRDESNRLSVTLECDRRDLSEKATGYLRLFYSLGSNEWHVQAGVWSSKTEPLQHLKPNAWKAIMEFGCEPTRTAKRIPKKEVPERVRKLTRIYRDIFLIPEKKHAEKVARKAVPMRPAT